MNASASDDYHSSTTNDRAHSTAVGARLEGCRFGVRSLGTARAFCAIANGRFALQAGLGFKRGDTDMSGDGSAAAGWHADPFGRHQLRYWDGSKWTAHVADDGVTASDSPKPSPQHKASPQPVVAPTVAAGAVNGSPGDASSPPATSNRKWILAAGIAVVVIIVIASVASNSDDSGSGGGSFKLRIADQAVFVSADYGDIDQLGDAGNAPSSCENASQSRQEASGIVASWSTPLQDASGLQNARRGDGHRRDDDQAGATVERGQIDHAGQLIGDCLTSC
jgi:Protein of unknown function (DUF2510)